jgi:probable rRNA maturation factor
LEIHHTEKTAELSQADQHHLLSLAERVRAAHPSLPEVNLVLTDDQYIRQLNASYRGKDRATDVLSFALEAMPLPPEALDQPGGEIYISVEMALVQANEQGVPLQEELGRLWIHGLLHLAGYDHDTPATLQFMESETERLLGGHL